MPTPESRMDPTSRGDMEAQLVRNWYERNRESLSDRFRKRWQYAADEFILGLIGEVGRVQSLSDQDLIESA